MLGTISGSGNIEIKQDTFIHLFKHMSSTYCVPGTHDTKVLIDSVHLLSACCVLGAELSAGMEINKVLSTL